MKKRRYVYRCGWCGEGFSDRWMFSAHVQAEAAARQLELNFTEGEGYARPVQDLGASK